MPSNQCTTSLMELGFAVGNMAGAEVCDSADYKQLEDILAGWQCRDTGGVGKLLDDFRSLLGRAQEECAEGACPPERCVDVWKVYNGLVKEVQPSELEGQITRGPIPPKVKGPPKISRARRGPVLPYVPPKPPAPTVVTQNDVGGEEAARYTRPSRGMGYGNEEGRKRWYPMRV